ncbi:MAG: hypothetical protein PHF74_01010 [Dehalococcoidales bacterium]|nr:hypothetical protein [Dehalococcoidales bacterium]
MTDNFAELTDLYQSITSSVTRTEDYFTTDEYQNLKKSNAIAYGKIKWLCQKLLEILQGKNSGEAISLPGIEKKISFYNRILKKQSIELLPSNIKDEIDDVIKGSFLLGLASYLYLYDNPSRNEFENADAAAVMKKLASNILDSSGKMRKYNKKLNTIPILIFEKYFDNCIAPVLNSKLNLGLLQCASARSYFTNLFFSGARFGEMLDKEMREVKA